MTAQNQKQQPYVGPRPFENKPEDIARFFGRSREARDIVSLIIAQRSLVVYGKSGTGKSSLLNAAVLPELEQRGVDVIKPLARVQGQTPSASLYEKIQNIYMYNVLEKWLGDPSKTLQYKSLHDYIAQRAAVKNDGEDTNIKVIVFDQFEEIFTGYHTRWEDREDFFDQVDDALAEDRSLRVVFSIREEYIADLDSYSHLIDGHLKVRFHLEPLLPDQARLAVIKPVEETHRPFEDEAAKHLVNELRAVPDSLMNGGQREYEQYVEPVVLQVVCQSLWEALEQQEQVNASQITSIGIAEVEQYAQIDNALINFYENCLLEAVMGIPPGGEDPTTGKPTSDQAQDLPTTEMLRTWFEEKLITEAGKRRPVVREGGQTGGMDNAIVDRLVSLHILRVEERRATAALYEIVHDRFVEPILESNQRWRLAQAQKQVEKQRRNQRRVFAVLAIAMVAVIIAVIVNANTAISDLELEIARSDWLATRAIGLGDGAPTMVSLAKTPDAVFLPTATAQAALANDWEPRPQEFDGVEMVFVPYGCFWMGSLNGREDERPIFEACTGNFWIDRYEVTYAQYTAYTDEISIESETLPWPKNETPQTRVSWQQSYEYCMQRHPTLTSRLPTEIEWEYAARGPNSRLYPWGNTPPEGGFVVYDPEPSDEENTGSQPVRDAQGKPPREAGGSWVGAYDMSGNVREWTMDTHPDYPLTPNPTGTISATQSGTEQTERTTRGGAYGSTNDSSLRAAARNEAPENLQISDTGFRCIVIED